MLLRRRQGGVFRREGRVLKKRWSVLKKAYLAGEQGGGPQPLLKKVEGVAP